MRTEQFTTERFFDAWQHAVAQAGNLSRQTSDDELNAACDEIHDLEAALLAAMPITILDLYRKIAVVLDAPAPDAATQEAQLAREARRALGIPETCALTNRGATDA